MLIGIAVLLISIGWMSVDLVFGWRSGVACAVHIMWTKIPLLLMFEVATRLWARWTGLGIRRMLAVRLGNARVPRYELPIIYLSAMLASISTMCSVVVRQDVGRARWIRRTIRMRTTGCLIPDVSSYVVEERLITRHSPFVRGSSADENQRRYSMWRALNSPILSRRNN
jgi:hypothetical protein